MSAMKLNNKTRVETKTHNLNMDANLELWKEIDADYIWICKLTYRSLCMSVEVLIINIILPFLCDEFWYVSFELSTFSRGK